ncbi:hypothetical protein HDU81_000800 [Chytriomyces hyalinus]|nr:hypothetical protein HDU81_000800 [Chytriomyces hyalinus]
MSATATILIPPPTYTGVFSGPMTSYIYSSFTCAVTTTPGCDLSPATSGASATAIYSFCSDTSFSSHLSLALKLPNNAPKNQTQLPTGLLFDGTPTCQGGIQYTGTCYKDGSNVPSCTYISSSSSTTDSSSSSSTVKTMTSIISTIITILILLCCCKACIQVCFFDGETIRMSDVKAYLADAEVRDRLRHRQQDIEREKRRDEAVKIEENRVRRENELAQAFNQSIANRALKEDKMKLALERASDEIVQQRHELAVREMERQKQLTTIVENSKDVQNQRLAQRFKKALALRAAQREEELKASGNNIKVIESNIIENGKVVGKRQEIQRERYARTDAEAHQLVGSIGNDLHQVTLPSASHSNNNNNVRRGGNASNMV